MKLLMPIKRQRIIPRADTVKEEFPEKMKIDFYIEGHVGQKKREEYCSCVSSSKVCFHGNHGKTFQDVKVYQNSI